MKYRVAILLFFLAFFVGLPMEKVRACGSSDHDHATTFHGETEQAESDEKAGCCSTDNCTCEENQPENPCSDDEKGHCHCPTCGFSLLVTPILLTGPFELSLPAFSDFLLKKQAFYFTRQQPEDVILPFWQPPQWVA